MKIIKKNYLIEVYYHHINQKIMNDINMHNMQYNKEGLIEVQTQQPYQLKHSVVGGSVIAVVAVVGTSVVGVVVVAVELSTYN